MKNDPTLDELGRCLMIGISIELHGDPDGIKHSGISREFDIAKLKQGDDLAEPGFRCGHITVKDITPEHITVAFDSEVLEVPYGERTEGKQSTGSYELTQYWAKYFQINLLTETMNKYNAVLALHANKDASIISETCDKEQEVLDNLNILIDKGYVDLYPMKALLSASNNWARQTIVRPGMFADILQEGIEKDTLNPDHSRAWVWMYEAVRSNQEQDPYFFFGDPELIEPLVQKAAEKGNYFAKKVKELMWQNTVDQWWELVESQLYDIAGAYVSRNLPDDIEQQKAGLISNLDNMISIGCNAVYPLKALLAASDNWETCKIVRFDKFRQIIKEGIDKNAFGKRSEKAWNWLEFAMEANDPSTFFENKDTWDDIFRGHFVPTHIVFLYNSYIQD